MNIHTALGATVALVALGFPATAAPATDAVAQALQANLDQSLSAFNKGDFEGYLHDFFPRLNYNGLMVERARLVSINQELRQSFPNLSMRYRSTRITPMSATEGSAMTVAEYDGDTKNYDGSGLPATYHEEGQVTALYRKVGDQWKTAQLQVAWNDSFIDVGQSFGLMGFSTLPILAGAQQPYSLRLFIGKDSRPNVEVYYAYALAPLKSVMEKEGAEQVFRGMRFAPVGANGVQKTFATPKAEGTYAHVLVMNKVWHQGEQEVILGQKVYTRMLRVE